MTITLNWKHGLLVAVVVVLGIASSIWAVKRMAQRDIVDAERAARIEELEHDIEAALHGKEEAHADADEARSEKDALAEQLAHYETALNQAERKPIPISEEIALLREERVILKDSLRLANEESQALRRALTLTGIALDHRTEQLDLTKKRYTALSRSKKKQKRRNILTAVGIGVGGFAFGYGMGKI